MTVNLLSQRLKAAKRELTALKTAHMRGLGLVNIYEQVVYIDPAGRTGQHELEIIITLDSSFPVYPFVQLLNKIDLSTQDARMGTLGFTYISPHQVKYGVLWWDAFGPANTDYVEVLSNAPISNVTYNWTS